MPHLGLGSPLPHLCRDWAQPCHICARTGLTPATSAPGPHAQVKGCRWHRSRRAASARPAASDLPWARIRSRSWDMRSSKCRAQAPPRQRDDRRARRHRAGSRCPLLTSWRAKRMVWPALARPCHICTGTGLTAATSAPGLGSPCHICTGTGLAPATSAPGLDSPLPQLHRDWAEGSPPCHICAANGLARCRICLSGEQHAPFESEASACPSAQRSTHASRRSSVSFHLGETDGERSGSPPEEVRCNMSQHGATCRPSQPVAAVVRYS